MFLATNVRWCISGHTTRTPIVGRICVIWRTVRFRLLEPLDNGVIDDLLLPFVVEVVFLMKIKLKDEDQVQQRTLLHSFRESRQFARREWQTWAECWCCACNCTRRKAPRTGQLVGPPAPCRPSEESSQRRIYFLPGFLWRSDWRSGRKKRI